MKPLDNEISSGDGERILVIRFSSLGDILLTAPALRALRRRFASAHIDFLVAKEYAEAASLIPGPDRVVTFDRRSGLTGLLYLRRQLSRRYSLLVDLQNSARSAFLRSAVFPLIWLKAKRYRLRRTLLVALKLNLYGSTLPVPLRYLNALSSIGAKDDGLGLCLSVPDEARSWIKTRIGQESEKNNTAVLCPGARHFTKRWPAERWIDVGNRLSASGRRIFVVISADEDILGREIAQAIHGAEVLDNCSLPQIAALFEHAGVVVSNDSGLMHLAAGVGASVVAIFGPTVREFGFFPFRAKSEVIERSLSCRPCTAIGNARCPKGHFKCMLETSPSDVVNAVVRVSGSTENMIS